MNLNFKPLGDRVLIQPTENKEKKSKGGIILTDSILKGQKVYGDVVAIGTGIFSQSGEVIPMTVKVGDRVMYKKDMGSEDVTIDGENNTRLAEQFAHNRGSTVMTENASSMGDELRGKVNHTSRSKGCTTSIK